MKINRQELKTKKNSTQKNQLPQQLSEREYIEWYTFRIFHILKFSTCDTRDFMRFGTFVKVAMTQRAALKKTK